MRCVGIWTQSPMNPARLTCSYALASRSTRRISVLSRDNGSEVEARASWRHCFFSELSAALPAYEIGQPLGRGTFGLVHEARHVALGRDAAIKQLWPDLLGDDDARRRFALEARSLAALDHPHIVRVYDYVEEGVYALVLERMRGGTLRDRLRRGPVSPAVACGISLAALRGLEHAHERGILHRDVKPQNLLFGNGGVVKLADFGLAKVIGAQGTNATGTACQPGTPAYMAPEQVSRSLGPTSRATDLWAVGAVLYEMLAGRRPFAEVPEFADMLYKRVTENPTPLSELAPEIPAALSEVVSRALARLPAERFQTAAEFADALARARA